MEGEFKHLMLFSENESKNESSLYFMFIEGVKCCSHFTVIKISSFV